jgi:hypothetical protein
MKKFYVASVIVSMVILFSYCKTTKKATASANTSTKITYDENIKLFISASCSPCHIPAKAGNKKPLDTYESVKTEVNDIIHRIELNPADRGFMPSKHDKLSDSTIAIIKKWKEDGLPEK